MKIKKNLIFFGKKRWKNRKIKKSQTFTQIHKFTAQHIGISLKCKKSLFVEIVILRHVCNIGRKYQIIVLTQHYFTEYYHIPNVPQFPYLSLFTKFTSSQFASKRLCNNEVIKHNLINSQNQLNKTLHFSSNVNFFFIFCLTCHNLRSILVCFIFLPSALKSYLIQFHWLHFFTLHDLKSYHQTYFEKPF